MIQKVGACSHSMLQQDSLGFYVKRVMYLLWLTLSLMHFQFHAKMSLIRQTFTWKHN